MRISFAVLAGLIGLFIVADRFAAYSSAQSAAVPSPAGRYAISTVQHSETNPYVIVCDTTTGDCWTRHVTAKGSWVPLSGPHSDVKP